MVTSSRHLPGQHPVALPLPLQAQAQVALPDRSPLRRAAVQLSHEEASFLRALGALDLLPIIVTLAFAYDYARGEHEDEDGFSARTFAELIGLRASGTCD